MPKVLTEDQVRRFERDGCLSPIRAMSPERVRHYRERFEDLEARLPDIKKMSPDAEWSETALANWSAVVTSRARLIFEDSKIGPSEAYGGTRPAT